MWTVLARISALQHSMGQQLLPMHKHQSSTHYRNLFYLFWQPVCLGLVFSLIELSNRCWSHNPSFILPPVCPASSPACFRLAVLHYIDDGLENVKIIE